MNYKEKIVYDHKVVLGKPVIKGTRITVELILRKLAEGSTTDNLLAMYNHLTKEDIYAVLSFKP